MLERCRSKPKKQTKKSKFCDFLKFHFYIILSLMLHCIFFLKQYGATLHSQMLNSDFFSHLLKKIGSAHLNTVKESKHWRPPMWKQKALRLSFKTYNLEDVQRALRTIDCRSLLIQILQWHYRNKHKQTPVVRSCCAGSRKEQHNSKAAHSSLSSC